LSNRSMGACRQVSDAQLAGIRGVHKGPPVRKGVGPNEGVWIETTVLSIESI
jgi:hypothetical protein